MSAVLERQRYAIAEAHVYLGVKRRAFDKHIRPLLPAPTRIGTSALWERVDLDAAFAEYRRQRNGRPGEKGEKTWADRIPRADTEGKTDAGTSTRSTVVTDFSAAASKVLLQRKAGSRSK